jgi:hypothetical protein
MRIRNLLIAAAVLSLAIPSLASAGSAYSRATGGGQILVSSEGGAGDTIAFTARNTTTDTDDARGQLQVIDRTGDGTGKDGVRIHGEVTCLQVTGNVAKIGGTIARDSSGNTDGFTLVVEDNGQGAEGTDMIAFQRVSDPTCDREDGDDDGSTELARGNAQVYAAP